MKLNIKKLIAPTIISVFVLLFAFTFSQAKATEKIIVDEQAQAYTEKSDFTDLMDKYNNGNYFLTLETYQKLPSAVQKEIDVIFDKQSRVSANWNGPVYDVYVNGKRVFFSASIKGSDGSLLYCMNPDKPTPRGNSYEIKKDKANQGIWNALRYNGSDVKANWAETSVAIWIIKTGKTSGDIVLADGTKINVTTMMKNNKIKKLVDYGRSHTSLEKVNINVVNTSSNYDKDKKMNIARGLVISGFSGKYKIEGLPSGVTIRNYQGSTVQNANSLDSGTKYDIWYEPNLDIHKEVKAIPLSAKQTYGMMWISSDNVQDLAYSFEVDPLSPGTFKLNADIATGSISGLKVARDIPFYNQPIRENFSVGSHSDIDDEKNPILYATKDNKQVIYVNDGDDESVSLQQLTYPNKEAFETENLYSTPIKYSYVDYEVISKEEFVLDEDGNKIEITDENGIEPGEENYIPTYETEIVNDTDENGVVKVKPLKDEDGNFIIVEATLEKNGKGVNYPTLREMQNIYGIGKVEFQLKDKDRKIIKTLTTTNDGKFSESDLLPGVYYVKESKTLDNLTLLTTEYKCEVNVGSECKLNNAKEIYNDAEFGEHVIQKVDTNGNPIAGVVFDIYGTNEDGSIDKDNKISEVTTDENGQAHFYYYGGNYAYQEVVASDDFIFNPNIEYFFEINVGKTSLSEVINWIKESKVIIDKTNIDGEFLQGATICLYDKTNDQMLINQDGENECFLSTDKSFEIYLPVKQLEDGSIIVGEYYAKETKAPNGFVLNETKFDIIIDGKGSEVTHKIVNKAIKLNKTGMDKKIPVNKTFNFNSTNFIFN